MLSIILWKADTPLVTPEEDVGIGKVSRFPQTWCTCGLLYLEQWCSEAKCRPGPTIKVRPFLPLKFAYKTLK